MVRVTNPEELGPRWERSVFSPALRPLSILAKGGADFRRPGGRRPGEGEVYVFRASKQS